MVVGAAGVVARAVADALAAPVAEGGAAAVSVPVGFDGEGELPVVAGAVDAAAVPPAAPVGLAVESVLGPASGVGAGVACGDDGLTAGRGRGACGLVSEES
ncbi:hypothetical protein KMT30_21810 [Streptomyces sp. IBSBF 2953]|uniref:hypothetical protein n=1 Tax=Streptomyces TaxID=1883 RepID=UPI002119CCFA|nr:hypothetical protein [Streptomyces scabiei]MCQ9181635.1 hypothetical protein [Streptomyces hayashii]MDX3112260.1 hypothetical protein [Streptomyces scabiei]